VTPLLLQPRRVEPWKIVWTGGLLLLLLFVAIRRGRNAPETAPNTIQWTGLTMGTTYSIVLAHPPLAERDRRTLHQAVEETMARINSLMSVYDPKSEISRFNDLPEGASLDISREFAHVLRFALDLAATSGKAFDPTVGPLVRLWGFGPPVIPEMTDPTPEAIRDAFTRVGAEKVQLKGVTLTKLAPGIQLDLNAVAKGYGVDAVAQTLRSRGFTRFMVEIGGEVGVSGLNPGGTPWRIGVDHPSPNALPGNRLSRVLHVTDCAIATSGDYRNFRTEASGQIVSHLFDPRIGRPIFRTWSSVTLLAKDCLTADGLATTMYVLGPDEGLSWLAREFPDCEAMFLITSPDGSVLTRETAGFISRTQPSLGVQNKPGDPVR